MLGLQGVGKSTILQKLAYDKYHNGCATYGFNVADVQHDDYTITLWEVGGYCKIREYWHRYYANKKAVIFVVDSNDRETIGGRFDEEIAILATHGFIRKSYSADAFAEFPSDLIPLIGGYCIDPKDAETAKHELHRVMQAEELHDAVLLVYANKQDLHNAMSYEEIVHRLDLRKLGERPWHVQLSVAHLGDGLHDGLDWLRKAVQSK